MHIISVTDFPLFCSFMLENALFCQQNARLKNRLFCSKFCRQNLSKPSFAQTNSPAMQAIQKLTEKRNLILTINTILFAHLHYFLSVFKV